MAARTPKRISPQLSRKLQKHPLGRQPDPSVKAGAGASGQYGVPLNAKPWEMGAVVIRQGGLKAFPGGVSDPHPEDVRKLAGIIAVGWCESSGRALATSHNPDGGTNRGWWQIDDKAHPQYDAKCLHDPICSTDAMLEISHEGADFSAWACHPNPGGHLADAREAFAKWDQVGQKALAGGVNLSNPLSGLDAIAGVLEAIAKFFVGLGELLLTPEGWLRLGKLIGGGALVAIGTNRLAKDTLGIDPIGSITSGAFAAFPVGRGVVGKVGGVASRASQTGAEAAA